MRITKHDPVSVRNRAPATSDGELENDVCLVLGGGAWRACFFLGLMKHLQESIGEKALSTWAFCGESAGAIFAVAMVSGMPFDELQKEFVSCAKLCSGYRCGLTGRGVILWGLIVRRIFAWQPESVLIEKARGRLAITFTARIGCSFVGMQATCFENVEEIFDACVGSCTIPLFSDYHNLWRLPRVAGYPALDGGLTAAGRYPMLPSSVYVFSISCGTSPDAELESVKLTIDVQPTHFIPVRRMFATPSEADIAGTRGCHLRTCPSRDFLLPPPFPTRHVCTLVSDMVMEGSTLAVTFFSSSTWRERARLTHDHALREQNVELQVESTNKPRLW